MFGSLNTNAYVFCYCFIMFYGIFDSHDMEFMGNLRCLHGRGCRSAWMPWQESVDEGARF